MLAWKEFYIWVNADACFFPFFTFFVKIKHKQNVTTQQSARKTVLKVQLCSSITILDKTWPIFHQKCCGFQKKINFITVASSHTRLRLSYDTVEIVFSYCSHYFNFFLFLWKLGAIIFVWCVFTVIKFTIIVFVLKLFFKA